MKSFFFDHSGMKLETMNKRDFGKSTDNLEINTPLNTKSIKREITREIIKFLENDKNENATY